MTLPNFLGIGTHKAGSSWLDMQLRSHPDVYLPTRRKEIHFFDQYYDRGVDWYQGFFPPPELLSSYQAIGEITPKYIFDPLVPQRIHETIPNCKLVSILRNPVDRAYSHYGDRVRNKAEKKSFASVLQQHPNVFARGLYSKQLERYLKYFPHENILVLIFEQIMRNPECALHKIAEFICVDDHKFNKNLIAHKVNVSFQPRFPRIRSLARNLQAFCRDRDWDWIVKTVKTLGMRRLFEFANRGSLPKLDPELRAALLAEYEPDIISLEHLLQVDLSIWRNP